MNEILVASAPVGVFSVQASAEDGSGRGGPPAVRWTPPDCFVDIAPDPQRFLVATSKDLSTRSWLEIELGWPRLIPRQT